MIRGAPSVQMQNIVGIRLNEIEQIEENERRAKANLEDEVYKVSEKMEEECFVKSPPESPGPSYPAAQDPRRIGQYWGYENSELAPPRSRSDVIEEEKHEEQERRKNLNLTGIL